MNPAEAMPKGEESPIDKFWALPEDKQLEIAEQIFGKKDLATFAYNWDQEHAPLDSYERTKFGKDLRSALQYIRQRELLKDKTNKLEEAMSE